MTRQKEQCRHGDECQGCYICRPQVQRSESPKRRSSSYFKKRFPRLHAGGRINRKKENEPVREDFQNVRFDFNNQKRD